MLYTVSDDGNELTLHSSDDTKESDKFFNELQKKTKFLDDTRRSEDSKVKILIIDSGFRPDAARDRELQET